jgi:anti-sigma regulatory factor (Ser/Thr protein kinase)
MSAPASRTPRPADRRRDMRPDEDVDELSTVFPSVAPSASSARRFVAAALRRWGCTHDFIELVLLLTSELVTNAYRHAGTETRVSVRLDGDCARVEVRDIGRGEPELRPLDTDRVDGRGLQIVDALADRWGYRSNSGGTAVWFELVRRP